MSRAVKRKHESKKRKAAWRKTDITDVENFLEEQRLQERTGTKDLSLQPDSELFLNDASPATPALTSRAIKKLKAQQPSKCFVSLENTSKVQDPIVKRNRVKTPYERKHPLTKAKIQRNKELGIIPQRELESLTDRINAGKKIKRFKTKEIAFDRDIWADEGEKKAPELESEWVDPKLEQYILKNHGKDIVKVPKIAHERRSKIKAVEKPIAGTSYNPKSKDLESLVESAVEKEEAIIKREQKFNRSLKPLYAKITKGEAKRRRREEMTQGFPINSEDEIDDDLSDTEYKTVNPPVRNKKKDLKQRRKQKESRIRKARIVKEKEELKKIKDLGTLKMFKKQLNKQDEAIKVKQENRAELRAKAKFEPRRLARKKFEGEEIPVPESTETLGNLRKIQPIGNVLVDRFVSLQKRNILAPNLKRLPRKRRLTAVKKNSHKEEPQQPLTKKQKKAAQAMKIHD